MAPDIGPVRLLSRFGVESILIYLLALVDKTEDSNYNMNEQKFNEPSFIIFKNEGDILWLKR